MYLCILHNLKNYVMYIEVCRAKYIPGVSRLRKKPLADPFERENRWDQSDRECCQECEAEEGQILTLWMAVQASET